MSHLKAKRHGVVVLVGNRPLGVTNMVVLHDTVPLTTSQHLIIIVGEALVFLHQIINGKTVAHGGGVIYLSHTCTRHSRVIHQLIEGILSLSRYLFLQGLTS